MKTFITFLLEHVIYEHKEWHQFVKQHGSKILDKMGHGDQYSGLQAEPGHGSPAHMTEYIKKHLGLSDVPKEHGKWILGEIQKGRIENLEDVSSTIIPNLQKFQTTQHIHGANLKNVKGPTELFNLVSKHSQDDRDARFGLTAGTDYHVAGENEHWTVIRPHTEKAACSFGKGSNWCTASESHSLFHEYTSEGRPLHIFIPKAPKYRGEKYQLHPDEFMSHRNEPIHKIEGEGPNFHERPLPEETENNPHIQQAKILDAFTSGNKEAAMAALNHPDFDSHPSHFDHAFNSPHKEVAMAALKHPNFGTNLDHIDAALESNHKEVQMAGVQHPNFGIGANHVFFAVTSPNKEVQMAGVRHPNFAVKSSNEDEMHHALTSPHKEVAMAALEHPNFGKSHDHLTKAFRSPHKEVAMAATNHPNFDSFYSIRMAVSSPHKEVAMAAIKHPNFHSYDVAILDALESPHKEVAMAAVNHPQFGSYDQIGSALKSPHKEVAMAAVNHPRFDYSSKQHFYAFRSQHPEVVEAAKRKQTSKT